MVTLDQKRIGDFIAELRKARGFTQACLADMLCVTHQAVSKWECGAALPDMEVLLTMREVFGISLDDILDCRMPSAEPPTAPVEAERGRETISEDRIEIHTTTTCAFGSAVTADECTIHGEADFKSDLTCDSLNVDGRANVGKQLRCDALVVSGTLEVGEATVCDSLANSGSTSCGGGLQCDNVQNSGILEVGGGAVADSVTNSGDLTVSGGLQSDNVQNSGILGVDGGAVADSVTNSGDLTVGGGIAVDQFKSSGIITMGGGLKADAIVFSGPFDINRGITAVGPSARGVTIMLSDGDCRARYVTTKSLAVHKPTDRPCGIVKLGEIRADHAELENVHADFAEIKTGKIGDGCRIGRLECGPDVEILPGAEVGAVTRGR